MDCNVLTEELVPFLSPGHKIGIVSCQCLVLTFAMLHVPLPFLQPVPLFDKIEEVTAQKLKERFAGKQFSAATGTGSADKEGLQQQLDKQVSSCCS